MSIGDPISGTPKGMLWTGRVLSALVTLAMLMAGVMSIAKPKDAVEGTIKMGYPESSMTVIGAAALIGAVLYAVPQTAVLGAIVLTGYFGGAVATHVRVGDPLFNCIFPIIFGAVAWLGIYFRDARLRRLIPLRR